VTLPRFIDRVGDALVGAAVGDRADLLAHLDTLVVEVSLSPRCATAGGGAETTTLTAAVLARLYPAFWVSGDQTAVGAFTDEVHRVNPLASVTHSDAPSTHSLLSLAVAGAPPVTVDVDGWHVLLDTECRIDARPSASPVVGLLAAALGAAYLFRSAFRHSVPRGRHEIEPATINLVTLQSWTDDVPLPMHGPNVGDLHLAGAGAVGQAAVLGLAAHAEVFGLEGVVHVIDPETVTLSNLQRYALAYDGDEGKAKVDLAVAKLQAAKVDAHAALERWGDGPASRPGRHSVLVALDTAADRLAVAAGTHASVWNAYTSTTDIGWSRHEQLGVLPCLGCMYWPTHTRPSRHEEIAAALRQHPLRVISYLVTHLPVGAPLQLVPTIAELPAPLEAPTWLATSLLHDLLGNGHLSPEQALAWANRDIEGLYRDGVCGGALVGLSGSVTGEVLVPLAHQSLVAGLMLSLQPLLSADPQLRELRPDSIDARLNLLAPLPPIIARPRTRTSGCLCGDTDYQAAAGSRPRAPTPVM